MNLSRLWSEHTQEQFPSGYGGTDVNGICISSLDSYIAGSISSYIGRGNKSINTDDYRKLLDYAIKLKSILALVDDEAFRYFSRLHEMCNIVIEEVIRDKID